MVSAIAEASPGRRKLIDFPGLIDQWGRSKPNPWIAESQHELRELAVRCSAPLAWRMRMLAQSRMDRHGHAAFGPRELHELLAKLDHKTGELVEVDRTAISKALKTLIAEGAVCDDSTTACIRFSQSAVQTGYGRNTDCRVHR